jgi:hypothetical protein
VAVLGAAAAFSADAATGDGAAGGGPLAAGAAAPIAPGVAGTPALAGASIGPA